MEFELTYYNIPVQYVSQDAPGTPPLLVQKWNVLVYFQYKTHIRSYLPFVFDQKKV